MPSGCLNFQVGSWAGRRITLQGAPQCPLMLCVLAIMALGSYVRIDGRPPSALAICDVFSGAGRSVMILPPPQDPLPPRPLPPPAALLAAPLSAGRASTGQQKSSPDTCHAGQHYRSPCWYETSMPQLLWSERHRRSPAAQSRKHRQRSPPPALQPSVASAPPTATHKVQKGAQPCYTCFFY